MTKADASPEERIVHPYTLRSVHFSERFSEETNCFDAKLYLGTKLVALCGNHGTGGPTDVHFESKADRLAAEAYCNSLPVHDIWNFGDERGDIEYRWDTEGLVDDLMQSWLEVDAKKKQLASIKRAAKTKLLVVVGDEDPSVSYAYYAKCVYGQEFRVDGQMVPIQDIMRDRLLAKGDTNIRFYDPSTDAWVRADASTVSDEFTLAEFIEE